KQLGLVAQEVEKILPELVSTSPNGYKAIDYSKLTPVLVEAIKEQNTIILNLHDRIDKLEKSNTKMSSDLEEMQQLKADILELKQLIKDKNDK
ncbi:MAG: secretion protein Por, partial [Bacteroidales bacterium]|nr:secretion protein Por [Bacteroidales bacterium]